MNDQEAEKKVEGNVINVPFRNSRDIYIFCSAGGSRDVAAAACCVEEWVIDVVLRFEKRKALRNKYFEIQGKDPA